MSGYGVQRLVVINSGSYGFADLALDSPIHLVAPNNRGKSTLVNALQFLYVDELRYMRFPKPPDETREHYFGDLGSYLVFECTTASGPQVLLVAGRGRVGGSAFSRFVYSGGFREEDFSDDDGRVVTLDVLRGRLANRGLTEVKPAELWEVLGNPTRRGRPENNGHPVAHLGLLPVRKKEDYQSFRETYVRLLSLSDANAAELRRLLISCHAAHLGEVHLDVAADYRDEFDRAERTDNRLAFLRGSASLIDDGERQRRLLDQHQETLLASAPQAIAVADLCHAALLSAADELEASEHELRQAQENIVGRRSQFDRQIGGAEKERGRLAAELAGLDQLHKRWSACSDEMVQAMRDNANDLQDRIAARREHIRQAGTFDLAAMRRSADALRSETDAQERSLANWERRVSTWLLEQNFEHRQIVDIFRALNPAILHLLLDDDVAVTNPESLLDRLRSAAERIEEGVYLDEDVRLRLSSLPVPDANDLRDPEAARQKLRLLQARLQEEVRLLAVAEDVDRATSELADLESQHRDVRSRLTEYDEYRRRWRDRSTIEQEVDRLTAQLEESEARLKELTDEARQHADQITTLSEEKQTCSELLSALARSRTRCESAIDAAGLVSQRDAAAPDWTEPESLAALRDATTRCCQSLDGVANAASAVRSIRDKLVSIQQTITETSRAHSGQHIYFSDADADWSELIDARRAVEELEQTASQNWETLFTTITAKLDALVRGAQSIGNASVKINAAMRQHRVSNLREVQLDIDRQHEACDLLESLTSPDGLFSDRDALDRAKDQLRRWIKNGKEIRLDDLFAIRIRVQEMDGHWTEARSLDDIGSTGTRMTAKAMIFIQLVRAVVGDERYRLHFYLDETGQLDDYNLNGITAMASGRGVVPITAEPRVRIEPLAHPSVTIYTLGCTQDGRFSIDQKRTLWAARRVAPVEPAEDVTEPA